METLMDHLRSSLLLISQNGDKIKTIAEHAKDREVVLIGEASHGTHEYYQMRCEISKVLIRDYGFRFIAIEGDWPSCFEVNEYVKGQSSIGSARKVLGKAFERWPRWMWVNEEIAEFIEWLKAFNSNLADEQKVGFYGLDVYSLWESLDMLAEYFRDDEHSLLQIHRTYACFEPYVRDEQRYANATYFMRKSCEDLAVELLRHMLKKNEITGFERELSTKVNALVVKDAEQYYRTMIRADNDSWNIRDHHMEAVFVEIRSYLNDAKGIIWEHNTHVGDARATSMSLVGLINVGQLIRERYGQGQTFIIGFGSYSGSVLAAESWGSEWESMSLPPAKPGSWESILHGYGKGEDLLLIFDKVSKRDPEITKGRGHRAVGVVYHPEYESGNYVPTNLSGRYDAFWFVDKTQALKTLASGGEQGELETYPSGV